MTKKANRLFREILSVYGTLSEEWDPGFAVFREIGEAEEWILS